MTSDRLTFYRPCTLARPMTMASIEPGDVLIILLAKTALLLALAAFLSGCVIGGIRVWQATFRPKLPITFAATTAVQDNLSKAETKASRATIAIAHANFRLTNTNVLNSIFGARVPDPVTYQLQKISITPLSLLTPSKATEAARDDSDDKPATRRQRPQPRLGYRLSANWIVAEASHWTAAKEQTEQLIRRLRPDLQPDMPWQPWSLELSHTQNQTPAARDGAASYVFDAVAVLTPPERVHALARTAKPAQAREALARFFAPGGAR